MHDWVLSFEHEVSHNESASCDSFAVAVELRDWADATSLKRKSNGFTNPPFTDNDKTGTEP